MTRAVRRALVGLMLIAAAQSGCSGGVVRTLPVMPASGAATSSSELRQFRVGTARVDITPPPGPATFGHGPDAVVSQGYWTRLECRVFVVEAVGEAGVERFAIVPCDLPAISYALFRDTAELAKSHVPGDHLLLTATHTHAGPAHYFESSAYASVLSTRRPGFDDNLLSMLSTRISGGIARAAGQLVKAELRWVSVPVWGITRNRSLAAFELDAAPLHGKDGATVCPSVVSAVGDQAALAPPPADFGDGPCKNLRAECAAIDPMLEMLEFREPSGKPLGSLTFFAMHPTVLPGHTRLFGGDAFGIASRELEAEMRRAWAATPGGGAKGSASLDADPLAGIINTNEGDIVPVWVKGDVPEAALIGRQIAAKAWAASALAPVSEFRDTAAIATRSVEADFALAAGRLGVDPERPAVLGQASSHGSSDHRASIDDIASRLPDWSSTGGEQQPKAPLLAGFQPVLTSVDGFPSRLPFSLWRIADRWLAAVPAELTFVAGQRIRSAVERATGEPGQRALIAGLANGYMQYVTTCEEFQLQRYEGASNLYGAQTQSFISDIQVKLACELTHGAAANCPTAFPPGVHPPPYAALPIAPDVDRTGDRLPLPVTGPREPAVAQQVCRLPRQVTPAFCFRWLDVPPGDLPLASREPAPGPWLRVRRTDASATVRWDPRDPRSFVDDRGDDFQVRARARCGRRRFSYTALFQPSDAEWWGIAGPTGPPPRSPRFVLSATDTQGRVMDIAFDTNSPACTRDELLYCVDEFDSPAAVPDLACK